MHAFKLYTTEKCCQSLLDFLTYRLACLIMLQSRGPELPCSNVYVAYLHSCVDS